MKYFIFASFIFSSSAFGSANISVSSLKFLTEARFSSAGNPDVLGLSGLAFDASTGEYFVISDDKRENPPSRFYKMNLNLADNALSIHIDGFQALKDERGRTFPKDSFDFEGIALLQDGRILVSSEGGFSSEKRVPPAILEFDPSGFLISQFTIPPQFIPDESGTQGVWLNRGFESLTVSPSEQHVFSASETALIQDGPMPGCEQPSPARLIDFNLNSNVSHQFIYTVDGVDNPDSSRPCKGSAGISELLALSDHELLALERGGTGRDNTTIRIYKVDVSEAMDVTSLESIKGKSVVPLQKKLLFEIKGSFDQSPSKGQPSVSDFEGMALGPVLSNGHRSLLLISDNNYPGPMQTDTVVQLYEILP